MNESKIDMIVNLILKMIFNAIAALIKYFKMESPNQLCLINGLTYLVHDFCFLIKA